MEMFHSPSWYEVRSESTGSSRLASGVLEEHQKDVLPDVHTPVHEGSEGMASD